MIHSEILSFYFCIFNLSLLWACSTYILNLAFFDIVFFSFHMLLVLSCLFSSSRSSSYSSYSRSGSRSSRSNSSRSRSGAAQRKKPSSPPPRRRERPTPQPSTPPPGKLLRLSEVRYNSFEGKHSVTFHFIKTVNPLRGRHL